MSAIITIQEADKLMGEARNKTLDEVASIADEWTKTQHILLYAGEMTASELRAVKVVANAIAVIVRGMKGKAQGETVEDRK